MIIGVPKEVKIEEYRVGLIPAGVYMLVSRGHKVLIEKGAGHGSGISDQEYVASGAEIVDSAEQIWRNCEMIIKVKEPIQSEYSLFQEGQLIFTYFHLAAVPELAPHLLDKKVTAVAYETVRLPDGSLPLLKPMSEVAGRMAIQVGATYLEKEKKGKGILLPGIPGVRPGRVTIIGAGTVGANAAKIAVGIGAEVRILDIDTKKLDHLENILHGRIVTLYSDYTTIEESVKWCDLLVGAVLIPGAKAPRLVSEELVSAMEAGSVIVDVAVDQGGCIETCHPTTHKEPTYIVHDVVHYCVANMPGAVARTSTFGLTNATIRYAVQLADHGLTKAMEKYPELEGGVNTFDGHVTHSAVAKALDLDFVPLRSLL